MPELPEVETLCRQLNDVLPGEEILQVEVLDTKLGKIEGLAGRLVESVRRRGKYLQFLIGGGQIAELHLRMSGKLFWQQKEVRPGFPVFPDRSAVNSAEGIEPLQPLFSYSRLVIVFPKGILTLIDPRRFATFSIRSTPDGHAPVEDPLEGLSVHRLLIAASTRRLPVKSFLMDQKQIAGIGNIYASEILFHAGINPRRPSMALSAAEWCKVARGAVTILRRAVACRGTTLSDWRDLFGSGGTNQHHLAVYARQGERCLRCDAIIERIIQSGRGTWFCPSCQG